MTPGATARLIGFRFLLRQDGEDLTVESADAPVIIQAIVNRDLTTQDVKKFGKDGAVDFTPLGMSQVELMRFNQQAFNPVAGDSMLDSLGARHRVRTVIGTDITWKCLCKTSEAA